MVGISYGSQMRLHVSECGVLLHVRIAKQTAIDGHDCLQSGFGGLVACGLFLESQDSKNAGKQRHTRSATPEDSGL